MNKRNARRAAMTMRSIAHQIEFAINMDVPEETPELIEELKDWIERFEKAMEK